MWSNTSPVRIAVSPAKAVAIRGVCVDPTGRPLAQAKVEMSSAGSFTPGGLDGVADRTKTDAEGRFEVRPLWSELSYSFTVRAEGCDLFESPWIQGEPGKVHDAGRIALVSAAGFVEGIVADAAGQPIVGARVFNSGDAPKPLATLSDQAGRFRLEGFRVGTVHVFAEKEGYRLSGIATETGRTGVRIELLRAAPRTALTFADEQKAVRRILERRWATPARLSASTIQLMVRIDFHQALQWADELDSHTEEQPYVRILREAVAERGSDRDVAEMIEPRLARADTGDYSVLKLLAQRYAASQPEKAIRFTTEAFLRGKKRYAESPGVAIEDAAFLLLRLGKIEAGGKLAAGLADLVEADAAAAEKAAPAPPPAQPTYPGMDPNGPGMVARCAEVRGVVAAALAAYDLPRALDMLKVISAPTSAIGPRREWRLRLRRSISTRHWGFSAGSTGSRRLPIEPGCRLPTSLRDAARRRRPRGRGHRRSFGREGQGRGAGLDGRGRVPTRSAIGPRHDRPEHGRLREPAGCLPGLERFCDFEASSWPASPPRRSWWAIPTWICW